VTHIAVSTFLAAEHKIHHARCKYVQLVGEMVNTSLFSFESRSAAFFDGTETAEVVMHDTESIS